MKHQTIVYFVLFFLALTGSSFADELQAINPANAFNKSGEYRIIDDNNGYIADLLVRFMGRGYRYAVKNNSNRQIHVKLKFINARGYTTSEFGVKPNSVKEGQDSNSYFEGVEIISVD